MPPLILNLGRLHYTRKRTRYRLIRRLRGPESSSGRFVENKKISWPHRNSNSGQTSPLVRIPTKLLGLQQQTGYASYRTHTHTHTHTPDDIAVLSGRTYCSAGMLCWYNQSVCTVHAEKGTDGRTDKTDTEAGWKNVGSINSYNYLFIVYLTTFVSNSDYVASNDWIAVVA